MTMKVLIWVFHLCGDPVYFLGVDPNNTSPSYLAYPIEQIADNPKALALFQRYLYAQDKTIMRVEWTEMDNSRKCS